MRGEPFIHLKQQIPIIFRFPAFPLFSGVMPTLFYIYLFFSRHFFALSGRVCPHLEFCRTAGRVRLSCPLMLFFHIIGLSERSSVPEHCMGWTCLVGCCSNLALCEVFRTLYILVPVNLLHLHCDWADRVTALDYGFVFEKKIRLVRR
jgi:hypothetical protein